MRLHVMLLDRDPRVSGLAARPLELRSREPGGVRAHAPQLMLRLADSQGCRRTAPPGRGFRSGSGSWPRWWGRSVRRWAGGTGCSGRSTAVYRRNVTWLAAGYPHLRHHCGQQLAAALQEAFADVETARRSCRDGPRLHAVGRHGWSEPLSGRLVATPRHSGGACPTTLDGAICSVYGFSSCSCPAAGTGPGLMES